jgi:hypothetical protein
MTSKGKALKGKGILSRKKENDERNDAKKEKDLKDRSKANGLC